GQLHGRGGDARKPFAKRGRETCQSQTARIRKLSDGTGCRAATNRPIRRAAGRGASLASSRELPLLRLPVREVLSRLDVVEPGCLADPHVSVLDGRVELVVRPRRV